MHFSLTALSDTFKIKRVNWRAEKRKRNTVIACIAMYLKTMRTWTYLESSSYYIPEVNFMHKCDLSNLTIYRIWYLKSNTTGATSGVASAYPSGAPAIGRVCVVYSLVFYVVSCVLLSVCPFHLLPWRCQFIFALWVWLSLLYLSSLF